MSEVSLRDYFAQLDTLLSTNAADEVIHHCRHILQYYPRNVAAYRYLGRALILNGRWDEGASALRRVLGVIPDDYIAHIGMSEIYDTKRQPDEAIWHLERAFEQTPYNRDLLDGIRSLYRRYRNVDQVKIQLTAAAVARQAMRNHQYGHAIETLRGALERQPNRLDLRLLLAEALWEHGEQVEAAEIALDILQVLPDCLAANRILTQLWLAEERPSDARRYLSHIEDVDPYLAVELATGRPAPDDAFKLRELDYARSAQHELARNRPDWLQALDDESLAAQMEPETARSTTGWVSALLRGAGAEAVRPTPQQEGAVDRFSDDWMAAVGKSAVESASAQADELPDDAALLGLSMPAPDRVEHASADFSFDFDDELDDALPDWELLTGEQAVESEPPAQAPAMAPNLEFPAASQAGEAAGYDAELDFPQPDPLAWLRETDIEIDEAAELENSFAAEADEATEMRLPEADANPLGWLGGYDDLLIEGEQAAATEGAPSDLSDPLDWLNSVNLDDDEPSIETASAAALSGQKLETDWLRMAQADFETPEAETENFEAPFAPAEAPTIPSPLATSLFDFGAAAAPPPETASGEPGDDVDWLTDISNHEPQAVPGPRRGLTALLNESNFDWLSDQQNGESSAEDSAAEDSATDSIMDEWLAEFGSTTPALPDQPSYEPDWITELDSAMNDEPMKPPSPDQPPDWGAELPPKANEEAENASSAGGSSEIEWGSPDDFAWPTAEESEAQPSDAIPDWLAELQPTNTFETTQPSMSTDTDDEDDQDAVPDWLAELEPRHPAEIGGMSFGEASENTAFGAQADWFTEPEAAATDDEAAMDWPHTVDDVAAELAAIESSLSSAGFQSSPEEANDEAPLPEVPDWLSEFEPQPVQDDEAPTAPADTELEDAFAAALPAAAQPIEGSGLEWLDDVGEQAAEQAAAELGATPQPETGVPDWLSELEPQVSTPIVDTSAETMDWLDEIAPAPPETFAFEEGSSGEPPSPAAPPEGDLPDWLVELTPDDQFDQEDRTTADEAPAEPAAFDFDAITAEPAATTGGPERGSEDWLIAIGAAAAASAAGAADPEDDAAFSSTNSEQPTSDEQAQEFDDEDWLIEPPVEAPLPAHEPLDLGEYEANAEDEDFEWLSEDEETDFATVETPSAGFDPLAQDEEDAEEKAAIDETVEALAIHGDVLVQKPASNAPDWLNAMVPGLDVDFEATEEDEPIEQAFAEEFADFDDEVEEATIAPTSREFGWLSEIVEQEETAEAVVERPRPRFAFGSRPAWLKFSSKPAWMKPSSEASGAAAKDQELPDWPDEPRDAESDTDIPDWLR